MSENIVIERIFDAPVEKVWDAWTNAEKIKKWWGPKDFTAPHIQIDLREGGKYLYCMHGSPAPGMDAQDMWSGGEFKEIVPNEKIIATDYFADKAGNKLPASDFGLSKDFPSEMDVAIIFETVGLNNTRLTITYSTLTETARQAMIDSQIETGWSQSLDKFAKALAE